jgi:alpha-tubulin suppressor-like RCC1 family protein
MPGASLGCESKTARKHCSEDGASTVVAPCPAGAPFCGADGACHACTLDEQCPKPALPCAAAACVAGDCGVTLVPNGNPAPSQLAHDCRSVVCDGEGGASEVIDETDAPADDGNPCTIEACSGATAVAGEFAPPGLPCGEAGVCSGLGTCGACVPGQRRCVDGGSFEECSADATWLPQKPCGTGNGACLDGACVAATGIATGAEHSCALLEGGHVRCWGSNERGQLGVGDASLLESSPRDVVGLEGVVQLALGASHTCALLADGSIRCWGDNQRAQLGHDASLLPALSPQPIGDSGLRAKRIVAGSHHTCAVRTKENDVVCWGDNEQRQIAPSGLVTFAAPQVVASFSGEPDVDAGDDFTCVRGSLGIYCRGANDRNQSSADDSATTLNLALVQNSMNAGSLVLGARHACATFADGKLFCWGDNTYRQFAFSFVDKVKSPMNMSTLFPPATTSITLGSGFSCGVEASEGAPLCVGNNSRGQLGQGFASPFETKVVAVPTPGTAALAAGQGHVCALLASGGIACWGAGDKGQLGRGNQGDAPSPASVLW